MERSIGTKYKARLVIKGFADRNIYHLTETFAPVARLSDVRFLLSVANKYHLDIHQMDVKTAFLNGKLENPVYVCKLEGALCGLKVSPLEDGMKGSAMKKKTIF